MLQKKYNYILLWLYAVGIALTIYLYLVDSELYLLPIVLAEIIIIILRFCSMKQLNQIVTLLRNGEVQQFEKMKNIFIACPVNGPNVALYQIIFTLYDYLRGNKEEALELMESMYRKCEKRRAYAFKHYQKGFAMNVILFSLVQGDIEKAKSYEPSYQELNKKKLRGFIYGDTKTYDYFSEFIHKAILFEDTRDEKLLEEMRMLLENEWTFYMRMYLMAFLARCYERIDEVKAFELYEIIADYGKELEIAELAKAKVGKGNLV